MAIVVNCECGKQLRARDELAGKRGKCPGCGKVFRLPQPEAPEPDLDSIFAQNTSDDSGQFPAEQTSEDEIPLANPEPAYEPAATTWKAPAAKATSYSVAATSSTVVTLPLSKPDGARRYLYWALLLALVPLGLSILQKSTDNTMDRFVNTVEAHPEISDAVERAMESEDDDALFAALPDHRIQGAHLAHDSSTHWLYAALSAALFFLVMLLLFPKGDTKIGHLVSVGVFTGTIGILFLLAVQLAGWLPNGLTGASSLGAVFS
jgi:hypothetical protein